MGQKAIIAGVERTLELRPPNTVRCDVEGCTEETYVERRPYGSNRNLKDPARAEAAGKGWGFVDGKDLCPTHLAEVVDR